MRKDSASKSLAAGLCSFVSILPSCPGVGPTGPSGSGTGVSGLDTPSQILSNPYVRNAVQTANNFGVYPTLNTEVSPPVISGRYNIEGEQYYPDQGAISFGTFSMFNQTADNHIRTDYQQLTQSGTSSEGEIIRGVGNEFTVYSILDVTESGCIERVVFILDGYQDSNGDIHASYLGTPSQQPKCFSVSVGRTDLTLTGPAKVIDLASIVNANSLIASLAR